MHRAVSTKAPRRRPSLHSRASVSGDRRRCGLAVPLLLLVCAQVLASSAFASPAPPPREEQAPPLMAVLPFANYTGTSEAPAYLMPLFYRRLAQCEVTILRDTELRPLLRRHRIRSSGGIGMQERQILYEASGAAFFLLGSLDLYDAEITPELSLSVRVVDATNPEIIRVLNVAANGEDYTGLFGLGRVNGMEVLADRLLDDLFAALGQQPYARRYDLRPDERRPRVLVIAFDNSSEWPHAGSIVGNALLAGLWSRNYTVLEPSFLRDIAPRDRDVPRGAVDLKTLAALRDSLDVDWVVTGVVTHFQPRRPGVEDSTPQVSLDARLLDARTGLPLRAFAREADGREGEFMFGSGRIHCLGQLIDRVLEEWIDIIDEESEAKFAAQEG